MVQVARLIDPGEQQGHVEAIRYQLQAVEDPERTPSAAILRELRAEGQTLAGYGLELARTDAGLLPLTRARVESAP